MFQANDSHHSFNQHISHGYSFQRFHDVPRGFPFGPARMELDRIRAGLGDGGLRFKSSVQELRFEPSYRSGVKAWEKKWGGWDDETGGCIIPLWWILMDCVYICIII
jgi:hypothetical protein